MSSPVHFLNYQIRRINYNVEDIDPENFGDGKVLDPDIELRFNKEDEDSFALILTSKLVSDDESIKIGKKYPIDLEIELIGFFALEGEIDEDERNFHLQISAPSMLYGIMRTQISQLTAQSGFAPIMIPSVQFAGLINSEESDESLGSSE
ncbi:MAG: protein-export chaperone SecB [Balneola sp.]|nr:protein-export chaperone SecB [Balneola sp.]MBO6649470.1 protein-export chaperone SecB [Balneola sp.]MBO6711285.1 protein-export chaperone SecB [Balneola sp.]MBO6800600.1 protein-export chaperone SecB [Balneola sp.]MBO6869221.1 protein-export chaperone SecB [Balneola sp.]